MLTTSARLLRLLTTLQGRRHWPGAELCERLEVTARTLRRDIDRLRELGYAVEAASGPGGGYQLGTGSVIPPLLLSDDEAVALSVSLRSAADTFSGVSDTVVAVLVKLDQLLPRRLRPRVSALHAMTVSVGKGSPLDADILITLATACRDSVELSFMYTKHNGSESSRRVEPLRLAHTGNRRWYLVAWDIDGEGWRTFRVDRIRAPKTGGRFTARKPPPDVEKYVAESIASAPYQHRARFRLFGSAGTMEERIPKWVGSIEPIDSQTCILTIGADTPEGLVSRIICASVDFELLDPPELGTRLREVAKRLTSAAARSDCIMPDEH